MEEIVEKKLNFENNEELNRLKLENKSMSEVIKRADETNNNLLVEIGNMKVNRKKEILRYNKFMNISGKILIFVSILLLITVIMVLF